MSSEQPSTPAEMGYPEKGPGRDAGGQSAAAHEPAAADGAGLDEGDLPSALDAARADAAQAKDQLLRLAAEMDNVRRRAAREVEAANKFGQEKLIAALVPVADNLERAVASAALPDSPELTAIAEGINLSLRLFLDTLARFGVETIDPIGAPFDPQRHQAMSMLENPNMEPNSVMQVLQKGYALNGRLVRPAMVIVSRASTPRVDERA